MDVSNRRVKRWQLTLVILATALIGSAILYRPLLSFGGLESPCTYISDLVSTNPLSSDLASTSDDHLRCIKTAVKGSFPNVNGAVSATDEVLSAAAATNVANTFTQNQTFSANLIPSGTRTLGTTSARWDVVYGSTLSDGTNLDLMSSTGTTALISSGSSWTAGSIRSAGAERISYSASLINLQATAVQINGTDVTAITATFTLTETAGISGSNSGTCRYERHGAMVSLRCDPISGTSDATNFTFSGIPVAIRPSAALLCGITEGVDNGGSKAGVGIILNADGTGSFQDDGSSTAWVASGTKSIGQGSVEWGCSYLITAAS